MLAAVILCLSLTVGGSALVQLDGAPVHLGEARGGEIEARKGAAVAEAAVLAAKQKTGDLEADLAKMDAALGDDKRKVRGYKSKEQLAVTKELAFQHNATEAAVVADRSKAALEKANTDKDAAEAHLEAAKKQASLANIARDKQEQELKNSQLEEVLDHKKVHVAKLALHKRKAELDAATEAFHQAQETFDRADHNVAILTGTAKKGESFEQFRARQMQKRQADTIHKLLLLDQAMVQAAKAQKHAQDAQAAVAKQASLHAEHAQAATEAHMKAERLRIQVEQARKDGTLTAEMEKAAKEAAEAAKLAATRLSETASELKTLKAHAKDAILSAGNASRKWASLKQLKSAEQALIEKREGDVTLALEDKKLADAALKSQTDKAHSLKDRASKAEKLAVDKNATLNQHIRQLDTENVNLEKEEADVMSQRQERAQLMEKEGDVLHIKVPKEMTADDASRLLEKKGGDLKQYADPLMETISKEKDAVTRKDAAETEVTKLRHEVHLDETSAEKAQAAAKATDWQAQQAEKALDGVQVRADTAKKTVHEDEQALKQAHTDLSTLQAKTSKEAQVVKRDVQSEKKLQQDADTAAAKMRRVEKEVAKSDREKMEKLEDLNHKARTAAPTPPLPVVASMVKKDKKSIKVEPLSGSLLERLDKLMSSKSGPCKDHDEWKLECPFLHEHCNDYMAMKLFCRKQCAFCH